MALYWLLIGGFVLWLHHFFVKAVSHSWLLWNDDGLIFFPENSWHFFEWLLSEGNSSYCVSILGGGTVVYHWAKTLAENAVEIFLCLTHFIVFVIIVNIASVVLLIIRNHCQHHRLSMVEFPWVGFLYHIQLTNPLIWMPRPLIRKEFACASTEPVVFPPLFCYSLQSRLLSAAFLFLFDSYAAICLPFCEQSFFWSASVRLPIQCYTYKHHLRCIFKLPKCKCTLLVDILNFRIEGIVLCFRTFGIVVQESVEGLSKKVVGSNFLPVQPCFSYIERILPSIFILLFSYCKKYRSVWISPLNFTTLKFLSLKKSARYLSPSRISFLKASSCQVLVLYYLSCSSSISSNVAFVSAGISVHF